MIDLINFRPAEVCYPFHDFCSLLSNLNAGEHGNQFSPILPNFETLYEEKIV